MTVVSVTMIGDTNIDLQQDVEVVIENDGSGGNDCTISIDGASGTGNGTANDNTFFDSEEAAKTFLEVSGEIRHLDEADAASEDAAGNPDGILGTQDDNDDAIGSYHQACIVDSPLTSADNADITWTINNGPGSSATIASIAKVAGPNDEPCVRWGSAGTGSQTIQASWDNGTADPVNFFFDSDDEPPGQAPLIKEWNDIDNTSIVFTDGNVGDTLADNSGSLANWSGRDTSFHQNANQDGTEVDVECTLIQGPVGFGSIDCSGESFIDYTFGDHADAGGAYDGPIDGAEQTYSVSGDCGSVRLEDPTTGNVIILYPGDSATVLTSDKGVGFQVLPNDEGAIETTPSNADCDPGSSITVDITTVEANLFDSPPLDTADDETVTVSFDVAPPGNKQPQLAWAGMRVVLEHNWGTDEQGCPWTNGEDPFYVRYTKQSGNGALISDLGDGIAFGPDFMIVEVNPSNNSKGQVGDWGEPNSDCISRVIYESQDEGEQDVVAHVVEPQCPDLGSTLPTKTQSGVNGSGVDGDFDFAGCDWSVISQQVAFVVYYMKLESVTLGIVPGAREDHNDGDFDADGNINDASADVDETTANVSADVLTRVRVKGWLTRSNCPARESGVDSNGGFLPANRCIFPDDWEYIAGGALAEEFRPNYDIMREPGVSTNTNIGCDDVPVAAGPFSWLDGFNCGDSLAPNSEGTQYRETIFPDGDVDEWDAPMPPSLIRLLLTGSGFIRPADKDSIYPEPSNLYYVTNIPAEPWITPINEDLTGYLWNSWGSGSKSGHYEFWTSLADKSSEVVSCPGASPCDDGVPTGGYSWIKIYTDNHGEAMAYVNGDANLTFDDCDTGAGSAGNSIVQLSGYYCEDGETVGTSSLTAAADYPDKRKHEPLDSNDVSITWTWGGTKEVSIVPGANAQFNYVVLSVTDRDGFCDSTTSLHPVLGELVEFQIDSPDGIIFPDANGNDAEGPPATVDADKKGADTHTFQSGGENSEITLDTGNEGDCQAWIHISSSLLGTVNVIVIAHDPEGTVTFDVVVNPPTPVPTPEPTPTPPPPHLFGDNDCDGDVDSVDALQGLRFIAGLEVFQTGPCHALGSSVDIDGSEAMFGDWDCDGDVDLVDQQAILRFVAGMSPIAQTEPCFDVGEAVTIS